MRVLSVSSFTYHLALGIVTVSCLRSAWVRGHNRRSDAGTLLPGRRYGITCCVMKVCVAPLHLHWSYVDDADAFGVSSNANPNVWSASQPMHAVLNASTSAHERAYTPHATGTCAISRRHWRKAHTVSCTLRQRCLLSRIV